MALPSVRNLATRSSSHRALTTTSASFIAKHRFTSLKKSWNESYIQIFALIAVETAYEGGLIYRRYNVTGLYGRHARYSDICHSSKRTAPASHSLLVAPCKWRAVLYTKSYTSQTVWLELTAQNLSPTGQSLGSQA